jgi:antitoxin ParD1/3/4
MSIETMHHLENEETARLRVEQAKAFKKIAAESGLKFDVYLPSGLAVWILDMVEKGIFIDPSEAIFVLMGQAKDLDPHDDLKTEILKRRLDESIRSADSGLVYSGEDVLNRMKQRHTVPRKEPALWKKIPLHQDSNR